MVHKCKSKFSDFSTKMLSKTIKYILIYFSVWGLSGINESFPKTLMFLIHVILCVWCSVRTFSSFFKEWIHMEILDGLNFLLYYLNSDLCYWLIIYDSYQMKCDQKAFWQIYQQINENFGKQPHSKIWRDFILLGILITGDAILFVMSIFYTNFIGSALLHSVLHCILDNRVFYYVYF